MIPRVHLTETEVEELLGAYVLNACEPEEVVAIEAVLARRPDLAFEADRLTEAVSWIGATEALEPPRALRDHVLDAARVRRVGPADPVVELYVSMSERLGRIIAALPKDAHDVVTPNGLCARDLVVHMAAQESLLAQNLGVPTIPDLEEGEIVPRTHALLPRYADAELDDAIELWRDSVETNRAWAVANPDRTAIWRGLGLTRDDTLLVRSFEAWVHTDDLYRAAGLETTRPEPRYLSLMSDLAGRILPLALTVAGRAREGKTARLVLTGEGGGDWLVAMDAGEAGDVPDVTVTADVVDWCMLVGDRIPPAELDYLAVGDPSLALDLIESAPSLATL